MKAIACVDARGGIGFRGRLLASIPEDLKRFRALTLGHILLYGRKTLETFPGQKPLPKRQNWVLSRQAGLILPGAEVFSSVDAVLRRAAVCAEAVCVIGGQEIYEAFLPHCDAVLLTVLDTVFEADRFFPPLDPAQWRLAETQAGGQWQGIPFHYDAYAVRSITAPPRQISPS